MPGKRLISGILSFSSALFLIVVILLTAIEQNAFDLDFFKSEYGKLNSTQIIGISERDLMDSTQVLLAYIKGERDNLEIEAVIKGEQRQVFNQREIRHMADVQKLYETGYGVRNAGIVLLMLLLGACRYGNGKKFWEYWAGGYLSATVFFLALLGAAAWAISRDFLWFWNSFHYLFFTNDLWQLDPSTDILIQMVPEQFFFDLVVRILLFFTAAIGVLAVIAGVILFRKRKKASSC